MVVWKKQGSPGKVNAAVGSPPDFLKKLNQIVLDFDIMQPDWVLYVFKEGTSDTVVI